MKIQVILASSRPNRVGERVAKWVLANAKDQPAWNVELIDLKDYDLPHFDEPISPKYNPNRPMNEITRRWVAKVAEADGYVIVTPEYNHSFPGHLKDALDYLDYQIEHKPVAIVGYGSVGGARAAEQLRLVVNFLGAAVVPSTVGLLTPDRVLDEGGHYIGDTSNPYGPPAALAAVLKDLSWWTATLNAGRLAEAAY